MKELGFGTRFDSVPPYIYNTSALHVAGNRAYSSRVKHVALQYFFIQELVKEGRIAVKYAKTEDQLADIGTKHLSKQRQRYLLNQADQRIQGLKYRSLDDQTVGAIFC